MGSTGFENQNLTLWPSPYRDWAFDLFKTVMEALGVKYEEMPPTPQELLERPTCFFPLPPSQDGGPPIYTFFDYGKFTIGSKTIDLKYAPNKLGPIQIDVPVNWGEIFQGNFQSFQDKFNTWMGDVRKGTADVSRVTNELRPYWDAIIDEASRQGFFIENGEIGIKFHSDPRGWGYPAKSGVDCLEEEEEEEEQPRRDPLFLDLNGDGIKTVAVRDGVYFDHNGDGFAELTGWVDEHDGLLVMDRNGNGVIDDGRELFGNDTILKSGAKATNGFQALAELDSNQDGKIDADDAAFSQLRVLAYSDIEGGYISASGFLYTLDELGIKSINLASTITNTADTQGNTQNRLGSFEKADGAIGQIGEYSLGRDTRNTIAKKWLDVPEDIAALPDLQGYGNVYDLHQAMARDGSGQLEALVEQFATMTDLNSRSATMEQILFEWTDSDSVAPNSRGPNMDGRKVSVLEKFFGRPFIGLHGPNPTYEAAISLNESYRRVFEMAYAGLMSQTHLKSLYDRLNYTWDDQQQEPKTDFTNVIPDLVSALNNDPVQGKQLVSEFARTLRGISSCSPDCYLTFREHMLEIDPTLGWVFDTGGLPVYDHLHQGTRGWSPHIEGTDNADAIRGSLTEGDGYLNGLMGNDVIYGTDRNEVLINESGDALLVAGAGNDQIWAGDGNDILDGGPGSDILKGEAGNDIYIFRRGSGQDTIIDPDATPGNTDTIWLGSDLTPDDIMLKRAGNSLVLKINNTTDTLTVQDFFRNDAALNRVEQIQFMDGTLWTEADIISKAYAPSEGDDVIWGSPENDTLSSLGGNDWINGRAGDDTLDGGTGNDTIYGETGNDSLQGGGGNDTLVGGPGNDTIDGGPGNDALYGSDWYWCDTYRWYGTAPSNGMDTYLFGRGSGQDTIFGQNTTPGATNIIALGEGILPTDVKLERVESDLKLTILDTPDTITVRNWIQGYTGGFGVSTIRFADPFVQRTKSFLTSPRAVSYSEQQSLKGLQEPSFFHSSHDFTRGDRGVTGQTPVR